MCSTLAARSTTINSPRLLRGYNDDP